ncbi:MAG: hypothetical protein RSC41_05065, partial [Oscillospiraceae bacterium]
SADFNIPIILAGIISSIIFGLLAIKMVRWIVTSNKFKYFGYYTLILGVITVVIGIIELMTNHSIQGFLIG